MGNRCFGCCPSSPHPISQSTPQPSLSNSAMGNRCFGCCPSSPHPISQSAPQPSLDPNSQCPPDPNSQSAPQPSLDPNSQCPSDPNSQSAPQPSLDPNSQCPPDPNSQVQIVKQQFGNIKDATDLDPLIHYIEQLLSKQEQHGQTTKPESSKTREFVTNNVEGASKLLEHISTEGEALQKSNLASKLPEEMENVVCRVLEGLGKLHWIAVGFSMIAFALERVQQVSSNSEKCVELLNTMFDLAKRLQEQHRRMPKESGNLNKIVLTVVEGVITCCSCMAEGKLFNYLFASTNDEKLRRIESVIAKAHTELNLMIATDVQERATDVQERTTDIQEQILRRYYVSEYRAPVDAVGIEYRANEVIRLLDVGGKEQRRAVILYGFGGVGKTTLGDCVMSKLDFRGLKHSRIQLEEKQSDMKSYQQELCADLTKERLQFKDSFEGRQKLQEVLEKESTFIFIDNALRKDQIADLLPPDLALPSKSRMLVTTRDIHVIDELRDRKLDCKKYRVEELPPDAAKEFFREFVRRCEPTIEKVLSLDKIDAVAKQCHGVPLLLRVYARYLATHPDAEVCDEMLDMFRKRDFSYTDDPVEEKLLYVYYKLRQDDKEAFVDVCTYFHGWSKKEVSYILRKRELNALVDGALMNIDSSDRVIVHDVLRAMGIKQGEVSRVQENDDWKRALAEKKEFKGLWLRDDHESDDVLDIEWQRLSAVRVLALGKRIRLTGECRASLPKLRYLHIEAPCGGEFPILEGMHALQYAHLTYWGEESPSSQRWLRENVKSMPNIQMLKLSVPRMKKFPDDFRFAKSLRDFNLIWCCDLEELPREIFTLTALQTLKLRPCFALEQLPREIGTLTALQTLELIMCERLEKLPREIGTLTALQRLDLGACKRLEELPREIGTLTALQTLDLRLCERLEELPREIGTLTALQRLELGGCKRLEELPREIGTLTALQTLELSGCERLEKLPREIGTLTALQTLDLDGCERLEELPREIGTLTALQTLNLSYRGRLVKLPDGFGNLKSLQYLQMSHCANLEILSDDFDGLKMLTHLDLSFCDNLDGNTLEKLTKLESLQELKITGSTKLIMKWSEMESKDFHFEVVEGW